VVLRLIVDSLFAATVPFGVVLFGVSARWYCG
jgi:hypothetical protein